MNIRAPALLLLLATLTGCAALFAPPPGCIDRGDGRCWHRLAVQIPVTTYTWERDTAENASARCGYEMPFEHATCVMARNRERRSCDIVSALTEAEAARIPTNSPLMRFRAFMSIRDHELIDHCGLLPDGTQGTQWGHAPGPIHDVLGRR